MSLLNYRSQIGYIIIYSTMPCPLEPVESAAFFGEGINQPALHYPTCLLHARG